MEAPMPDEKLAAGDIAVELLGLFPPAIRISVLEENHFATVQD